MLFAGIDAGSRAIKLVLLDGESGDVVGRGIADQGVHQAMLARDLVTRVLADTNHASDEVRATVATGYGRTQIDMATKAVTEITCHGRGVGHLHPEARTVIDIGGQDSKLLCLDEQGGVRDFAMNDRCAAGTGRFLEVVAERLDVPLDRLGALAAEAVAPAAISSMCVVFAETEIVGLLAANESSANIVAGVQQAIASRLSSMAGRMTVAPVVFTGGVALVPGMCDALGDALSVPVSVADAPQYTGALGAALLAIDMAG